MVMSGETLIVGIVRFKDSVSREEREKLLERIKDALELPDNMESVVNGAFNERYRDGTYYFCHVNWSSNLSEEEIEGLLKQIGDKLENYDVTLYYLDNGVCFFRDEFGEDGRCEVC
jgi:YHS domain-containing protein